MEKKMEGIGKATEGGISKSISLVVWTPEAKLRDGTKVEATLSKEPSNSEISARLPPGSTFGEDNRRLGEWAKIEQPPGAGNGQKMEFDTDLITAEKRGRFNLQKRKTPPMVCASTGGWGANERRGDQNYQAFLTNGRGGESIPQTQHKGSFANTGKGGSQH